MWTYGERQTFTSLLHGWCLYFLKSHHSSVQKHRLWYQTNQCIFFLIRAMESTFPTALSISLVVNVILGIIFSGMYIFLYPGMTSTEENPEVQEARLTSRSPTNNEFCVSCDYLGQSLFTSNTLYTDVVTVNCGNEHRLCCYNDTVLQRFIFSAVDISPLQNKYLSWY